MDVQKLLIIICCIISGYNGLANDRIVPLELQLIKLEKFRNIPETSVYNQIMNYSKESPFSDEHGRSTSSHETVHGINSYLRNKYKRETKKNVNGFYCGNGYGIIIENPKFRLRQIAQYVPHSLRGYRFKMYFESQLGDWDDTPTYPIDEWASYIAGAETAVDDAVVQERPREKSDCVSGSLEFSIYCVGLAMATKDLDPDYWNNKHQLKYAVNYFLIKAEKVFFEGKDIFPSAKQEALLNNLKNSKDAENIRQFLKTEFQGVFIE